MKLYIAGSGKLANAIINAQAFSKGEILRWGAEYLQLNEPGIIIHAGSGRQLDECIAFCTRTKSVLVELSTGLKTETAEPDFPLVICPNTSILLLKTLKMLEVFGSAFKDYEVSITESHQQAKQTEPGTAYAFAESLGLPVGSISSVRDPQVQENQIGIPAEFLSKHAYHKIVIKDGLDELTIETKVLGHDSYAKGVKAIVDTVRKLHLENRRYTVLELIRGGVL
jgi:4-hydroxy-tetrahydrodipicolinate reductase